MVAVDIDFCCGMEQLLSTACFQNNVYVSTSQIPLKIQLILDFNMLFCAIVEVQLAWVKRAMLSSAILLPTTLVYLLVSNLRESRFVPVFEFISTSAQVATVLFAAVYSLFDSPNAEKKTVDRFLPLKFIEKHSISGIFCGFLGAFFIFFAHLFYEYEFASTFSSLSAVFYFLCE